MQEFGFNARGAFSYETTLGKGFGSVVLANIFYQFPSGIFAYKVDDLGNTILDNQGLSNEANDGQIYSGRGLELLATNNLSIPIHHTLGAELVTNGTFDTDTVWIKGIGWTIGGGKANCDGTQTTNTGLQQSGIATAGQTYLIEFDLIVTAGLITWVAIGGGIDNTNLTTSGHYSVILTATTTDNLSIAGDLDFIGSVDNVTVKQITTENSYLTYYDFSKSGFVTLGNSVNGGSSANLEKVVNGGFDTDTVWVKTGGWGISVGKASVINAAIESFLYQPILVQGISYRVIFDVDSFSGTFTVIDNIGTVLHTVTSTGNNTFSFTYKGTNSNLLFRIAAGSSASIDNVSVRQILPISTTYTLNTKTANNFLTHTTNWSASDWTKINNNPNLVGKLALETTGATKTIPELDMVMDAGASADKWYPCSENERAYVVDARAGYGIENVVNGDFATTSTTGWSFVSATGTVVSNELEITTSATNASARYNFTSVAGKYYRFSFDVRAGTMVGYNYSVYDWQNSLEIIAPTAYDVTKGIVSVIFKATGNNTGVYPTRTATTAGTMYVDNVSVREATAQEISNYAATIRTNADFSQKGLQTTAFVQDGAGIPTAYSSNLLQFNGDGRYVNTKVSPPSDKAWEMDYVMYLLLNSSSDYSGFFGVNSVNRLAISQNVQNRLVIEAGASIYTSPIFTEGMVYVRIIFDGLGNFTIDVNNSTVATFIASTYTYSATEVFWLGALSRAGALHAGNEMASQIGTFQYKLGTRTAPERNAYYAQLKTIYPTLP